MQLTNQALIYKPRSDSKNKQHKKKRDDIFFETLNHQHNASQVGEIATAKSCGSPEPVTSACAGRSGSFTSFVSRAFCRFRAETLHKIWACRINKIWSCRDEVKSGVSGLRGETTRRMFADEYANNWARKNIFWKLPRLNPPTSPHRIATARGCLR